MSTLIIVFLTAIVVLFSGTSGRGKFSRYIGIAGLLLALVVSFQPECSFFAKYQSMYIYDETAALFTRIAIIITTLIFFLGGFALSNHRSHQSELYALMLFALCGGIILFGFENMTVLHTALCNGGE